MHARYEVRRARKKFTTEFEAAPGGAFKGGDRMTVAVDAIQVGAVRLKPVVGGDLVGDLNLDTTAGLVIRPSHFQQLSVSSAWYKGGGCDQWE